MAEEQQLNRDAIIEGFDADYFAGDVADGGGYVRHPIGDYRERVEAVEILTSKGKTPHNMIVVTSRTIALAGSGDETAIGMTSKERYGGPHSPEFMKKRGRNFFKAIGVVGPFSPKMVIGREYDATVVWDKGTPAINEVGEERVYVNSRICFERSKGAPKPDRANAKALSAAAISYLAEKEDEREPDDGNGVGVHSDAPTWEAPQQAQAEARVMDARPAQAAAPAPTTWLPLAQEPPMASMYRAVIVLGRPEAGKAKSALVAKNVDPNGPIDETKLTEPIKSEYATFKARRDAILAESATAAAASSDGELPGLDLTPTPTKLRTGRRTPVTS